MDNLETLSNIFGPVTEIEATFTVHARATYYPQYVSLYIPNEPYSKKVEGMEFCSDTITVSNKQDQLTKEQNQERSIRRTQSTVRDYVLCNQFQHFATFTFKQDRQNVEKCKSKMNSWLKNQKIRNGKFEYLLIPEFHKDGKSIHFHGLLQDYTGKLEPAINPKTNKILTKNGRIIYTFKEYKSGFTNVIEIEQNIQSYKKVGNYIRKYITKDMPLFHAKNRYWASFGLKLPKTEDNPDKWYLKAKPLWSKELEYGKVLHFTYEEIEKAKQ